MDSVPRRAVFTDFSVRQTSSALFYAFGLAEPFDRPGSYEDPPKDVGAETSRRSSSAAALLA